MDYEKKYSEALKEIRELISLLKKNDVITDNGIIESNLQRIFPELAESEDERIRKLIRSLLENVRAVQSNTSLYKQYDDALAWLEKQKEQKPEERFEEAREKYQVEWSEEDENKIKDIIDYLECWNDFDHGSESFEEYRKRMEGNIQFMKSLRPSWKPSEQEKGALRTAIHILTDERSFPKAAAQLQNILNAFEGKESRKDWKPSEDEERLINTSISFLKDFADKGYENAVECIDWLKSKLNGNSCK